MGRKVGLDLNAITDAAVAIVEADGLDAATLSSVAASLGIKAPSLYNHVSGLAGLRRLISLHAADRLTDCYQAALDATESSAGSNDNPSPAAAGADGGDATSAARLHSIANTHRRFAIDHPGLYQALLPAPKPGDDDELYEAMGRPVRVVAQAMAKSDSGTGTETDIPPETIHQLRALRSIIHGFVDLELNSGFGIPVDIDASFDAAVDTVITGMIQ